jgi:hypothetical protein
VTSLTHHLSIRTATMWIIPPGLAIAYFCPAHVSPGEFLFYALPILAGYWVLTFKTSQLLAQWQSQPAASPDTHHATAIRYKYFFAVSLLIPVILFTAQVPASPETLTASGIHDTEQGQVMIWGLRNFLSLGLTTVVSIYFYRRLKSQLAQQEHSNCQEDKSEENIDHHQDK